MTSDVHGGTSHGKSESYEMEEIELEMKSSSSSLDGPDVIREQAFRLAVAGQGEYTSLRCDELWTAPIYNYARFFSWAQSVERVARAFEVASARTKLDRLSLELEGNDREELKELVEVEFEDVEATTSVLSTRWAPGIFSRFFIASFLALVLQWGTTGAAMIVNYFTPAYGIGCRTASYLLYGALGTLSWGLLMLSAFLSHYSTTTASSNPQAFQGPHTSRRRRTPKPNRSGGSMTATCIRRLSIALRIIGKTLAYANAIWILVACIFQFTNFYDRCWCNSSVISLGVSRAYYVIEISWDEVPAMRLYWIAGVTVAAGSATLYAAFNQLFPSS
ncbi:hypothetical protein H0H92_009550 [Tricholoma furcatifolium]|nr:hypothetical protein H0H92_009550 [Tricholoma furcatifolium]